MREQDKNFFPQSMTYSIGPNDYEIKQEAYFNDGKLSSSKTIKTRITQE